MLKCASAEEKGGGKERRAHRDAEEAHLCSKGRRSHVAVGKECRKLSDVWQRYLCTKRINSWAQRLRPGTGVREGHRGLEAGVGGW